MINDQVLTQPQNYLGIQAMNQLRNELGYVGREESNVVDSHYVGHY